MPFGDWVALLEAEAGKGEVPFSRLCYRTVKMNYATEADCLSTAGSLIAGGRYNTAVFGGLYLSLHPATTMYEVAHYAGMTTTAFQPRATVGVAVSLSHILDLTNGAVLTRLGITTKQLHVDWVPDTSSGTAALTHEIAEAAYGLGYEAILAPSARDPNGGSNLIVYMDNLRSSSQVRLISTDGLRSS